MRTTAFDPPFPNDLGSWIACFRHRVIDEGGHPKSPEQVAAEIEVSGPTVRRWEKGRLRPSAVHVAELGRVCRLTSIQIAFLARAMRSGGPMPVPDFSMFAAKATPILSVEFPVYMMDSMLYIRGWNSYLPQFLGRDVLPREDYHYIDFIIDAERSPGVQPSLRDRLRRAILEFWYLTADSCGTPEYKALLARLCQHEIFREEWARLPFISEEDCPEIGLPRRAYRKDIGESLICPFVAILPPLYQVRQFMPLDETAAARLEEIRRPGPPEVFLDPYAHWARNGTGEAYVKVDRYST